MKPLTAGIRTAVLLVFVDIALLLNFLRNPYFVLGGLFFLESFIATVIIIGLVSAAVLIGYRILRRYTVYRLARYFALFMIINSVINIIFAAFIRDDVAGFLARISGSEVFYAYILLQVLSFVINMWLYKLLKHAYEFLR